MTFDLSDLLLKVLLPMRFCEAQRLAQAQLACANIYLLFQLLQTRQSLTPEQINEACYVDINANKAVFDSLNNNHKVNYDGKRFSYKSKHDLKGKDQLLSLIRRFSEGLPVVDVKDAYPSVMEELQVVFETHAASICGIDACAPSKCSLLFPLCEFKNVPLYDDMVDIEKELQKNGMKPATNTAKSRAMAQVHGIISKPKPKKRREVGRRTKLTNAHLPELFQNSNTPDS
uniref:Uncharacterized protein LOC105058838 n=1 Tax=Elaeis guineensis var. tenera TaxID=51953 RepID=A0A6I9SAV6_ELAGV|nr:uncharacterized protein LOC105058838 [Elaeis guineensis]